jgi:dipeptidyl aminopeptidase/acylaminoacyl peptidase
MRDAERRAWAVVKQAYDERTPAAKRAPRRLVAALVVAAVVAIAAVATPPGHAVFQKVREAVGVQQAEPALFSLPSQGRLLVVSAEHGGVWLIHDNGLKRRIGSYEDAQWSPHGLFAVATTKTALLAVDLENGVDVRWSLPRRGAFWPRWEGTRLDTRIAYMTPGGLRVVAGDGTGDHLLDRSARAVPPAWDPSLLHAVAYFARGAIVLRNADSGQTLWRTAVPVAPLSVGWSSDGKYLEAVWKRKILVLDAKGRVERIVTRLAGGFTDAAFQPGTHRLAVSLRTAIGSEVRVIDVDRPGRGQILFAGPGAFDSIVWSPDGRWLLVGWPTADQWLFLHGSRVRAVANIREQFPRRDHKGPSLQFDSRWCCAR